MCLCVTELLKDVPVPPLNRLSPQMLRVGCMKSLAAPMVHKQLHEHGYVGHLLTALRSSVLLIGGDLGYP